MTLILPHAVIIVRHTALPWLYRIRCSCGYKAFAPSWEKGLACKQQHLEEEEPFPDLSFLAEPEKRSP